MMNNACRRHEDRSRPVPHPALETIHLTAGARLVPESLLEPPFSNDRGHILHEQAAVLLDRNLRRLARMHSPVELRIARLLGRMKHLSAYLDLGFARMTDYGIERLGLSARRTQVLVQMDHRLRSLPDTARAFEAGRVSQSQVRLLLRVATPDTERTWLDRATRMNVRQLEQEVRRARAAAAADDADASDATGHPALAGDTSPAGGPPTAMPVADAVPIEEGSEEPYVPLSIPAPAWLRGRWEWAVEVFRRTAGAATPVWEAAEGIAADYIAGLPHGLRPGIDRPADAAMAAQQSHTTIANETNGTEESNGTEETNGCSAEPSHQTAGGIPGLSSGIADLPTDSADELSGCAQDDAGIELFEEVQRALEDELGASEWAPPVTNIEVTLPPDLDSVALGNDDAGGAASLDHRLRGLIELRQNLAWHQGRLLRTFANYRLYRALGFASFSRYCRENLGMSVRRARGLIALERRLLELPHLARAYRDGELSWVKASEIARVANEETEREWIHFGRSVTVRRIREEVALTASNIDDVTAPLYARRGGPPGLTPDGQVQLCAPSVQPLPLPPSPGDEAPTPTADAAPGSTDDSAPDSTAGVQTCAPVTGIESSTTRAPGPTPNDLEVQTCARSNLITTRIRFRAPVAAAQVWRYALAVCRAVEGNHLQDWECVAKMIESFHRTWDLRGSPAWQRRYRIFERDGWRCRVPGCSSRRNLQAHHVVFLSRGGGGEDDNLVTVCITHHLRCLHAETLRCHRLPGGLFAWEFGSSAGSGTGDGTIERYVEDVLWAAARSSARAAARSISSEIDRPQPRTGDRSRFRV
jgi:hypothetical protein